MNWFGLLVIICTVIIVIGMTSIIMVDSIKEIKYCKGEGFDGTNLVPLGCTRCYKIINHSSGTGTIHTYSGCI